MNFKVGDKVLVIDEDFSGIVKAVKGNTISVETNDGFILDFNAEELLKTSQQKKLTSEDILTSNIYDVISEKEQSGKRRSQPKQRAKDRYEPTMEVDLHIQ